MAFRKKANLIEDLKPDIAIIPECENPDKLFSTTKLNKPTDFLWFGHNPNKGLGIFSYTDFKFNLLKKHNASFKTIIPLSVSNKHYNFKLLAIWANNPGDKDGQYITQVWKAINHYNNIIGKKTILIGDFNSNTIWDKPKRTGNHSDVVKHLEEKKIHSTYHYYFDHEQGHEKHPTLYMYRHKDKPYHIDYCFASQDILKHLKSVEIGEFNSWTKFSDHVPVITSFKKSLYK